MANVGFTEIVMLVGVPVAFLLFFLICRHLVLWYWKVNRIVELLESIDARLTRDGPR